MISFAAGVIKFFLIVIAAFVLLQYPARVEAAAPEITVLLDNIPVRFDVSPEVRQGRTMVPFRRLAEAMGVVVDWRANTRTIHARKEVLLVELQVNNPTAMRNGSPVELAVAPIIVNGRTLVPLRFFAETFGGTVEWDEQTRTVRMTSPPAGMAVIGFYALGGSLVIGGPPTSSWTDLFGAQFPEITAGHTDVVSEIALGWYTLNEAGDLLVRNPRNAWQRPGGWESVLVAAETYRLKTEMVVHETNRDGLLRAFLNNPQAMDRAVAAIVEEARLYDGVNLNLEGLGLLEQGQELERIRDKFTAFVERLVRPLRASNKTLTLTIHPPNSVYRAYDYEALGRLADRIIIMAHDYGPVPEPINRVLQAVRMAVAVVPPEKLILGISIPSETVQSIPFKIGVAKRYRLQGISLWRLGLITDEMWQAIRTAVLPR